MEKNYAKIAKQTLFGMLLVLILGTYTSAQSSGNLPDCDTYGRIFNNSGDTLDCMYNIYTDDGLLLNPVEFDPQVAIIDSMRIHFSYEFTNNYTCQGEPVIIHCFEVVETPEYCEAAIEYYPLDCDSLEDGLDCGENVYHFVAVTNPQAELWMWLVDNQVVSYDESFIYEFSEPGEHIVSLRTVAEDSCYASASERFYIAPNPSDSCWVNIYYDEIPGSDSTMEYQFSSSSSDSIISWYWTVDGQYASNQPSLTAYFEDPGYHEVCLSVEMITGCQSMSCVTVYINLCDIDVDIAYHPIDSIIGDVDSMTYYIYGVVNSDAPVSWIWRFDGIQVSTQSSFEYTFPAKGHYPIEVLVTNEIGCEGREFDTIVVGIPPVDCYADFYFYEVSPNDSLEYSKNDILQLGSTFQFINTSQGQDLSYYWDFGDGSTTSEMNPVHTFMYPGVYNVALHINSSSTFCFDSVIKQVVVDSAMDCNAYFEYCFYTSYPDDTLGIDTIIPGEEKLIVGFKNLSTPDNYYSHWDFGDGTYSNEKNPVHRYQQSGTYEVCLQINTPYGCYNIYCESVKVGIPECEVDFTYNMIVPDCEGFNIAYVFNPITTSQEVSFRWSFGDGEYSSEDNPIHMYEQYGIYEVCVHAFYANGCSVYECKKIQFGQDVIDSAFIRKCYTSPVRDLEQTESISLKELFPVPAQSSMTFVIESEKEQIVQIELIDILGKHYQLYSNEWLSAGMNQVELNLNGLKTGNYFYVMTSDSGVVRGQILIVE